MDNGQITALAREYAKETGEAFPTSLEIKQRNMETHLRWLCDRYALVEKSNEPKWIAPDKRLPEIRERVLICEKVANQYKVFIGKRVPSPCSDGWEWNQSTKESVVAWMPLPKYANEIAKVG